MPAMIRRWMVILLVFGWTVGWTSASELGTAVVEAFRANAWTRLSVFLGKEGRVYVRLPNLRSGFLTADQTRALFREMEKRLITRSFEVIHDDGSPRNRWLVRATWRVHDRAHRQDFEYTVEIGWEHRQAGWQLIVLQTR